MLASFVRQCLTGSALLFLAVSCASQAPIDDDDVQSWNEIQVTAPITKKVDLYNVVTIQFGKNLTGIVNSRFSVGTIIKPVKGLAITPFVMFMSVRNSHDVFRYEYRANLRAVYKHQFEKFAVSHRSQFEYRIRPGANTWRYRPSITLEKELPKKYFPGLKAYVTEEPFYDSASSRFSRNRFSVGLSRVINKTTTFDVYYLYQGDNFSHPASINVIGTALKLKL